MSDGSLRYDAIFEGIFKSEVLLDYDISRITENKIRICLKYVLYTHSYTKAEKQYITDFANNFIDGRNIRDDGPYLKWNSKNLRLERSGDHPIVLKELRKTNARWLDEVKSHCEININSDFVIGCYGLTKNPETNEFMLILSQYKYDLREYMAENHSSLTYHTKQNDLVIPDGN
nr:12863_t:CDS:2 [Entrophospora candida]